MSINQFDNYPLTWRPDRSKLTRPIYQSLVDQLEKDILTGKLKKNTRLPSQRELADFLDINFTTVGQAYKKGVSNGLLYTNIGSGTYVSQNALNTITISNDSIKDAIIDFGLVSSFEECNELVVPYIREVSNYQNLGDYLNYQEPLGSPTQLTIAKNWLATQGVVTENENIGIVSGTQNGLLVTLMALFSSGDRIAIDRYTYANFIELATLLELELVLIDYDENGMKPELLAMECKKKKIHGIFVMPSCNNPVGFQMSLERRKQLTKIIKKEKLWIIEDDIHSFLTTYFDNEVLPPFQALLPEQTIYLAGMTKFICSGIRIAYIVFPLSVSSLIKTTIFNVNVKSSGLDAEIISRFLSSKSVDKLLAKKFELTKKANDLFDTYFDAPRPSNPYPFYRNIPISSKVPQDQIEQQLLKNGVRIYHSNRFSTQYQKDPFIRVALSSNTLEVLELGLKILKKSLTS